ncbi:hypothetical protein TRVL_06285 [Trypanosoma vivax]|nr:hypothetical protein TRVL_06285 [Trypanosoma vivax]
MRNRWITNGIGKPAELVRGKLRYHRAQATAVQLPTVVKHLFGRVFLHNARCVPSENIRAFFAPHARLHALRCARRMLFAQMRAVLIVATAAFCSYCLCFDC